MKNLLTFDIECYTNYFLVFFMNIQTGETHEFRQYNDERDHQLFEVYNVLTDPNNTIISFNGNSYDVPLTALFLTNTTNLALKKASDDIINNRVMWWEFERKYDIVLPEFDHIDIIQVAPQTASLKVYGARIGTKKLQELPIHHQTIIMPHQVEVLDKYCHNDNIVTKELYLELEEAIKLRTVMSHEYGIDLRSKSDAQIAEQVIKSEYETKTGNRLQKTSASKSYKYNAPSFVFFQTEQFKDLLNLCQSVDFDISDKGAVLMPKKLNQVIEVANKGYQMGIGGLHSVDTPASYYADDEYEIIDIDVTSYYPNVILNGGFEPAHIGSLFTEIYKDILNRRVKAKQEKDMVVANSLKITINGLFGKFGSRYSVVYSPDLMFHTTVTGQLCLFMLIEQFAIADIPVISANTDGITVKVSKAMRPHLDSLVKWWELSTNLNMEYTFYKSIHFRDVNNYLAVKDDGAKGKGIFAETSLSKSPANEIIYEAAKAYILEGTDVYYTISECSDIAKFLTLKKVTGGANKDGEPLGATVRWYRSTATDTPISKNKLKKDGTPEKVGSSECGMPLMNLPDEFPEDLDIAWYAQEAQQIIEQVKVK